MTNRGKRISELTALTSASLDTTIVGIDNGVTYKIELDTLADAVTSRVNILDRSRLSSLESVTSSFETKGRSIISSSAQITALGFLSSSTDITSLNSFTSSQTILNNAFTNGINARLQTSSFNEFSASVHNEIVAATNEQDLSSYVTQLVVNTLSGSVDGRLDNLELNSGSYLTTLNGAISSSSQLTSSYDERYVLSGSITQTTWDNIENKPIDIISSSQQLSDLGFAITGSNLFIGEEIISGSLILSSSVPTTLAGAESDKKGTIVFDENYLYYCFADYTGNIGEGGGGTTHLFDAQGGIGWNDYGNNFLSIGLSQEGEAVPPVAGWYFIDDNGDVKQLLNDPLWFSGGNPSPYPNGAGWMAVVDSSFVYNNSNPTITFYESNPGGVATDIWKKISLNTINGLISGSQQITDLGFISASADIADFTFTSETISNNNITLDVNNNITLQTSNGDIILNPDGNAYIGSANSGNGIVTDGYLESIIGDTSIINNGTGHTITDIIANVSSSILTSLSGAISGAQQISDLGFVTGSYAYLTEFNSLTQSFNIISGSVVNITNAVDVTQLNNTTASLNDFTASLKNAISVSGSGSGSVTRIYGNLQIEGTTTTVSASNLTISNNFIYLNDDNTITNTDLGIAGNYNDGTYAHTGIFSDASDNHIWKIFKGYTLEPSQSIDTSHGSFQLADFKANKIYGEINASNNVISSSTQLPSGIVSGSSQLTASYDTRYTLSGSVQPLPSNLVSSSAQITAFGFISSSQTINTASLATTGSNTFIGTETISGSLLLSGSFSYNGTPLQNGFAFAQPKLTRILDNASYTGASAWTTSYTGSGGAIIVTVNASGWRSSIGTGTAQLLRDGVAVASQTFYFNIANYHTPLPPIVYVSNSETGSHTYSIYYNNILADGGDYATINVLEYGNSAMFPTTIISGSSQLTSSFDIRYAPSASYLTSLNGAYSSSIQTLGGSGVYSSSAQLPSGLISGSSQLTASYDTRYTLSGSVVSGTTPAGTISGSSQLTSSFDGRYVQTGSFNTLTASFNSFTASAQSVTTGSNSFNGTQTITGSLIITTGSFVGSQILANTSSLYLTSGSNMYVQNNGVVEITGSLKVSGSAAFNVSALSVDGRGGDEGGEINLAIPVTNTTLQNRVTTDIWQNRFRVFEGSANSKGVFVDLSKAPAGVGGELMWKASGLVNLGVDVTLGDLKARLPSTGNKSLQLSTTSAGVTYSVYGSGIYTQAGSTVGTTINATSPLSVTSTPAYLASGYNFGTAGATDTWVIMDTSNTIAWRITMILGSGFNNNMISIERLV